MSRRQTCNGCEYWDKHSKAHHSGEEWGQCRRRAPSGAMPEGDETRPTTEWPNTMASDWCGEYVQRGYGW